MVNPEVKEKWVAALRSGEYEQGFGKLKVVDGGSATYCCLGVLCELAAQEGVVTGVETRGDGVVFFDDQPCYLPLSVMKWANLPTRPYVGDNPDADDTWLSSLNDDGKPLEEIADLIEENL